MRTRVQRDALAALTVLLVALLSACDLYDSGLLKGGFGRGPDVVPYERRCGDGRVDSDEKCDTAIAEGAEGACPATCPSEDACAPRALAGMDCQAQCVGIEITRPIDGDRCCPEGSGPADDGDCGFCGDKVIGPTETCEPPDCASPETCGIFTSCIRGKFTGDPDACTSSCELIVIKACADDDGCCPSDCNAGSDNDCSATCGNGVIETESGETCEPTSELAMCPASCDDGIACTTDIPSGSAENCNLTCSHLPVTAPAYGDGCCPTGATAANDGDCLPVCGNLVVEPTEACDPCPGDCADSDPCTVDVRSGSGCNVSCSHTPLTDAMNGDACCPPGENANSDSDCPSVCGNGVIEPGETCDGSARCVGNCTQQLPSSMIHRYSFDGSGTTVVDSIGDADGVVMNTSLQSTGALALAGGTSDQYVDLPNGLLDGLTNATFEVWLTWSGSGSYPRIFDFGTNASGGQGQSGSAGANFVYLSPSQGSGKARLQVKTGSGTVYSASADSSANTPVNTPVHFAAVLDGSGETMRVYMNGTQVGSNGWFANLSELTANNNNWLGRSQNSSDPELGGSLDEFRIYNIALSSAQITASYNAGPNP